MTTESKPPRISREIVNHLREVLPRKPYSPADSSSAILYSEGKQYVVDYLAQLLENQDGL
jgi:hypothetical protein